MNLKEVIRLSKHNKKFQLSKEEIELHKDIIAKELELTKLPIILVDKDIDKDFPPNFFGLRKQGNAFHYNNLPEAYKKYSDVGVITLTNKRKATLAHEMKHAQQYQKSHKRMQGKRSLYHKFLYLFFYPIYSTEKEAFKYGLEYVNKTETIQEYNQYKSEDTKRNISYIVLLALILIILPFVVITELH